MTERKLAEEGFEFTVKALEDQDDAWLQRQKDEGFMTAPIVQIDYPSGGQIMWAGYRPDLIEGLENR